MISQAKKEAVPKTIPFKCPSCSRIHEITLEWTEIQEAKLKLKLIQKAFGHEERGQVILVHIDWDLRIRRITPCSYSSTAGVANQANSATKKAIEFVSIFPNDDKTHLDRPVAIRLRKTDEKGLQGLIASMAAS